MLIFMCVGGVLSSLDPLTVPTGEKCLRAAHAGNTFRYCVLAVPLGHVFPDTMTKCRRIRCYYWRIPGIGLLVMKTMRKCGVVLHALHACAACMEPTHCILILEEGQWKIQ